jgi:hypothetical protein
MKYSKELNQEIKNILEKNKVEFPLPISNMDFVEKFSISIHFKNPGDNNGALFI